MIKLFYRLFNHDKIDEMQRTIEIYKERNSQLEEENREYKGYKLKYEVTKLYVEDDEALLELFDVAKKHDARVTAEQYRNNVLRGMQAAQQQVTSGYFGGIGGMYGSGGLSGIASMGKALIRRKH